MQHLKTLVKYWVENAIRFIRESAPLLQALSYASSPTFGDKKKKNKTQRAVGGEVQLQLTEKALCLRVYPSTKNQTLTTPCVSRGPNYRQA